MKNFEKWEKEIIELANGKATFGVLKIGGKPCKCNNMECCNCLLGELANKLNLSCNNARTLWFYQEYKEPIKLSQLEFELLKHFKKLGFEYIVKDKDGDYVYMYSDKVHKGKSGWFYERGDVEALRLFKDYFQFVEWADEEPYSIQVILDNCEVEMND